MVVGADVGGGHGIYKSDWWITVRIDEKKEEERVGR
jgi:hypothetical protein